MADIDDMGTENLSQGICGFTSALYAAWECIPYMQASLTSRMRTGLGRTAHLKELIGEFLTELAKSDGGRLLIEDIEELTRSFGGQYSSFTIQSYGSGLTGATDYSIAMPPEAVVELLHGWGLRWNFVIGQGTGPAILGLSRPNMTNRWYNLAHYVYRRGDGRILSWGQQFTGLADVNTKKSKNYTPEFAIEVHG